MSKKQKSSSKSKKKPWGVFLAIFLAILVGSSLSKEATFLNINLYYLFDTVGSIFLNALTLVVVPLVSSSIISGIAKIGGDESFKRLGKKIFSFYVLTSLLAILTGLFFVNIISPGSIEKTAMIQSSNEELAKISEQFLEQGSDTIIKILVSIVPSNILSALSQGEMLSLIFFSLLFGYSISRIESENGTILKGFFQGIFQAMIQFTHIIMKFLPYGVFCLVAKVFMGSGLSSLNSVGLFALTVLLGLASFMFVVLPLLLKWVAKVKPSLHLKAMTPALVTAFSTSSSSAALPVTIDCLEKRAKVSNRICSLVVPLGTSVNMSGSALYECVAAIFVAQCYGMDLTIWTQLLIVLLSLITSIGIAGIPSASLVAILVILKAVGLPAEGVGLFIAADRLLDMCRTTVNVFSDSCCAVLVAKSEGEKNVLTGEIEDV